MRLIIVRHGETEENLANVVQGQLPGHLSGRGAQQAQRLCHRLQKEPVDVIYCSDLQRCKDTIAPYLAERNTPIHYVKELRERAYGIFEGKPASELKTWRSHLSAEDRSLECPPGGESFADMQRRALSFLNQVYAREVGKDVLFVTHGGPKIALLLHLLGEGVEKYEHYRAPNTAVSIFQISDDNKHHAECVNCVRHLD